MNTWIPIKYCGFWDVPRNFIMRHEGVLLLFDSPFLEELDDYTSDYRVYVLPAIRDDELPKDWTTLVPRASRFLGEIPIAQVKFDATRREKVLAESVEGLLRSLSRTIA